MRINEVKNKEVNVTLSSDELVRLQNVLYFYENHYWIDSDASTPNQSFHELAAQIIVASNLCQYGHLDSFALDCIMKHNIAANPEARMKQVKEMLEKEEDKKA